MTSEKHTAPCSSFRVPIFATLWWTVMMMMLRKWGDSCTLIIPTSQQHLQTPHRSFHSRLALNSASPLGLSPNAAPKLQDETSGDDRDVWERCWSLAGGAGLCVQAVCLLPSRLLHWVHQPAGLKQEDSFYNKLNEVLLWLHTLVITIPNVKWKSNTSLSIYCFIAKGMVQSSCFSKISSLIYRPDCMWLSLKVPYTTLRTSSCHTRASQTKQMAANGHTSFKLDRNEIKLIKTTYK